MEGWCGSGGGGMAVCVSRGEGVLGEKTETKLLWLKFRRAVRNSNGRWWGRVVGWYSDEVGGGVAA